MGPRYPVSTEAGDEDLSKAVKDTEPPTASVLNGDPTPPTRGRPKGGGRGPHHRGPQRKREPAPRQPRAVIREDVG